MGNEVGNPGGQGQSPAPAVVPFPGFILKDSNCCVRCFLTLMLP